MRQVLGVEGGRGRGGRAGECVWCRWWKLQRLKGSREVGSKEGLAKRKESEGHTFNAQPSLSQLISLLIAYPCPLSAHSSASCMMLGFLRARAQTVCAAGAMARGGMRGVQRAEGGCRRRKWKAANSRKIRGKVSIITRSQRCMLSALAEANCLPASSRACGGRGWEEEITNSQKFPGMF